LEASAVNREVAEARGYRSITTRAELTRLGFGDSQRRVPALLIPVRNVHGEIATYQLRADEPRMLRGKSVKYETPAGARMVLDVPPGAREWLCDPKIPLFITEGIRKADAAVSKGLCCIALLGVWNWRGSNQDGGKVALADWESIALNGRVIYIVFDSDVVQKREVWKALERLQSFLESRGATVHVQCLPPGPMGEKVGLDDYLASGHTVEHLLALPAPTQPSSVEEDATADPDAPYQTSDGRICFRKQTRDGPVLEPLCNFTAEVQEEVLIDDGVETSRAFVLGGRLVNGAPLALVRIAADRFARMEWVTTGWGLEAVVRAGMANRDRLREAIQSLSPNALRRRVYAHTGWREIDGKWAYLTATGAVGADGVEVELGEGLSRYSLPPEPQDPVKAMQASLDLLGTAPATVAFPLWAAVYRAPLAAFLPLDLGVWIEGQTGSLKSTEAALYLSHYGLFDRTNLPGNWSSTANALEKQAFTLKDAMFVIDDYAPTAIDLRELQSKAARILRAQGNLAGRGRLRSDLTERPGYPPRGLILGTGEARPTGRSIVARTFLLEMSRDAINFDQLNASQAAVGLLPHAMVAYLQWVAHQLPALRGHLRETFRDARSRASATGTHLRIPEALAHLWVGLHCGLSCAVDLGACTLSRADELRHQGWNALVERATAQSYLLDQERPVRIFLQILATLLTQKRVELLPKEQSMFREPRECVALGWHDDERLYLLPEAAFQTVARFARDAGEPFPVSQQTLRADLVRERVAEHEQGRLTATARVGGGTHRVLILRLTAVEAILGAALPGLSPVVTGITGFAG
jgi:DNA polymerase-1